jgi:choline-sulfatase
LLRFTRLSFISAALILGGAALAVAIRGVPEKSARLNLVLLSVESFRADAATPESMPKLHAAAARGHGVVFRNHRAVSAWTVPNIVALLSGTHPVRQGIHSRGQRLTGPSANSLADDAGHGFRIHSIQPFALIESYAGLGLVREPGGNIEEALARLRLSATPHGLWFHYLDTHLPHAPRLADGTRLKPDSPGFDKALGIPPARSQAEFDRRKAVATQPVVPVAQARFPLSDRGWVRRYYDSNIAVFDNWFERFFEIYEKTGLAKNTVLIVTADHGEELAEYGRVGHASTTREASLAREAVAIPLFVWTPDPKVRATLRRWADSGLITDHIDIGMSLLPLATNMAAANSNRPPIPAPLRGRDLTQAPVPRASAAFTSAAGFAEPNPSTTAYYLASLETPQARLVQRFDAKSRFRREDESEGDLKVLQDLRQTLSRVRDALVFPAKPDADPSGGRSNAPIAWIWPKISGVVGYDDIAGHSEIMWQDVGARGYVIDYEAGTDAMAMRGTIATEAARYRFGNIDREYWRKFIVPYRMLKLRVRSTDGTRRSDWLIFRLDEDKQ